KKPDSPGIIMLLYNKNILICTYFEIEFANGIVKLLPFGHSRHYPLQFTIGDRKIISGQLNFFNSVLYRNFIPENFIPENKCRIEGQAQSKDLIIFNVLDNCFGHSLLKLFFVLDYIEQKTGSDFLMIIPEGLRHFLKIRPG